MRRYVMMILMLAAMAASALAVDEAAPAILNTNDAQFLNQDPDPAIAGNDVEIRIKVENVGRNHMTDVVFELTPVYPLSLFPGDDGMRNLGTVYAKQIGEDAFVLYYRLKVDKDAEEGDHTVRIRYKTGSDGDNWRRLDDFDVRIEDEDPVLAVESIDTDPELVKPGEEAELRIRLNNMEGSYVKNIHVNLGLFSATQGTQGTSVVEMPFSPIGSSNEKIIPSIDEGEIEEVSFRLITDADAESQVYKFPLTLTYTDDAGTDYSKEQIISVRVGMEPDLVVYLDSDEPFIVGNTDSLDVRFVNKGISDIKFLYATLKDSSDYEQISTESQYVGNIDSDDYETAQFRIRCKECAGGEATFPITVEYMDANNVKYTKDIMLQQKVYTTAQAQEKGLTNDTNTVTGILIVVAIVVVGIILWRVFRKKKHKNAH